MFRKGGRNRKSVAKIWIEANGAKCIEIAESELSAKENKMIVDAIDRHWEWINDQYFSFEHMTRVYSVLDLLKAA